MRETRGKLLDLAVGCPAMGEPSEEQEQKLSAALIATTLWDKYLSDHKFKESEVGAISRPFKAARRSDKPLEIRQFITDQLTSVKTYAYNICLSVVADQVAVGTTPSRLKDLLGEEYSPMIDKVESQHSEVVSPENTPHPGQLIPNKIDRELPPVVEPHLFK